MAFTAITALIAGAEVTAPLVLAAVAEVGTAMTVVGAVTGNKDLMKVGGVLGLVGGVGGLVSGMADAGAAGLGEAATNSALDSASQQAMDAYGGTAGAEAVTGDVVNGMENAATGAGTQAAADAGGGIISSAVDPAAGLATSAGDLAAGAPALTSAEGAVGAAPVDTSVAGQTAAAQPLQGAPNVGTPAGDVTGKVTGAVAPNTNMGSDVYSTGAGNAGALGNPNAGLTPPVDSASFLQKMMAMAQDPRNKTVLQLGAKLAGGALQGMQQQSQFSTKVGLEKQRIAQTSYGSQVGQNRPRGGIILGGRR